MRASTHGLVINIIHSLCTCTKPAFSEEALRVLRLSLDEFALPKFYQLFGISKVHSAATTAFRSACRVAGERWSAVDRSFSLSNNDKERLSLTSLEAITDALLEIMEACSASIEGCNWLQIWTGLAKSFAFRYNPALQPRGLIVFGCIAKVITDHDIKQLLRILVKALESFTDITLIDAIVMCLTRLQPLLRPESPIHKALFWVAVSILQLDEIALYASGLALLEQNLHTLDCQNTFETESLDSIMLATREPLEWHFKQLDHSVGLSFRANFHFALVGHLIKGYRHPSPSTVTRTNRIFSMLLSIIARPNGRDKFEVTPNSVAYLAAVLPVSEEVRSRCHVKHQLGDAAVTAESPLVDNFAVDNHLRLLSGNSSPVQPPVQSPDPRDQDLPVNQQRQKSLEVMDQSAMTQARLVRSPGTPGSGGSLKLKERSMSMPTRPASQASTVQMSSQAGTPLKAPGEETDSFGSDSPRLLVRPGSPGAGQERVSVSNDNNILLDPEILTDNMTQVLVLTVLATLVKYTTDENEVRILYEYLAEASVVFPKVFPVIHSLLDAKITNVLQLCHDKTILAAVQVRTLHLNCDLTVASQAIIENMISCEDTSQQQLHFLQVLLMVNEETI
jgi:neurofibromin 1